MPLALAVPTTDFPIPRNPKPGQVPEFWVHCGASPLWSRLHRFGAKRTPRLPVAELATIAAPLRHARVHLHFHALQPVNGLPAKVLGGRLGRAGAMQRGAGCRSIQAAEATCTE